MHLMIAGRLQWRAGAVKLARRRTLATFVFDSGTLILTEAGTQRRASLSSSGAMGAGAVRPRRLECSRPAQTRSRRGSVREHTSKRALADPRLSAESASVTRTRSCTAPLSPLLLTARMTDEQVARLFDATRATLREWTERLRRETGEAFRRR